LEVIEHINTELPPTTYTITAEVFRVSPDKDGNRLVTEAQHVAVKRALAGLRRKGLVVGCRDTMHARAPGDGRIELCHRWQRARQANREEIDSDDDKDGDFYLP